MVKRPFQSQARGALAHPRCGHGQSDHAGVRTLPKRRPSSFARMWCCLPRHRPCLPSIADRPPVSHSVGELIDTVHQRVRLGILSGLTGSRRADFGYLREHRVDLDPASTTSALEVTNGNLSKHLQGLEAAGYVSIEKTFADRRPRTWVAATKAGRAAFTAEVAA